MSECLKHFPSQASRKGYETHINNVHLLSGHCCHHHRHHHSFTLSFCFWFTLLMKYWSSLLPLLSLFLLQQKITLVYWTEKKLDGNWSAISWRQTATFCACHGKNAGRSLCIFCLECQISNIWFMRLVSSTTRNANVVPISNILFIHSYSTCISLSVVNLVFFWFVWILPIGLEKPKLSNFFLSFIQVQPGLWKTKTQAKNLPRRIPTTHTQYRNVNPLNGVSTQWRVCLFWVFFAVYFVSSRQKEEIKSKYSSNTYDVQTKNTEKYSSNQQKWR